MNVEKYKFYTSSQDPGWKESSVTMCWSFGCDCINQKWIICQKPKRGCLDCDVICIFKKLYKVQLVFEKVLMNAFFPELQIESNDRK